MIPDKWDVEELSKQLRDPSKERIDLDCDACKVIVDTIQFLARQDATEDVIATVATEFCIKFLYQYKHFDKSVCTQAVQEFKVSYSKCDIV